MDTNTFYNSVQSLNLIYGDCKKIYKNLDGTWYEATNEALNDKTCKKYYGTGINTDTDGVPLNTSGKNSDVYIETANKISFSIDSFGMYSGLLRVTFENLFVKLSKSIYFFNWDDIKTTSYWKGDTKISEVIIHVESGITLIIPELDAVKIMTNCNTSTIKRLST